ncbi:nuclear polyadenylated RNA-binding protein 3 [Podospora bellae-mahoneyi]|uniref:Nuclear polyadenylated RNA-binding protein 3 n=1 Tax=Podospora bellae-mahoneyi TaxID=2093777 RepID=A0ABR0FGA4_9PEZI|nr:nuclear polyadenylated RNA-binding protein 3 [Podospora bellae-mahoneyi]
MSEQSPEIVAAASLSPLSPKPISVQIQSNSVVPMLQDQAATADTAMSGIIVDPGLETPDAPAPVSDTIVVVGDSSDFHDDSDGSIDYGEEDEAAEKPSATSDGAADAPPDNDEYARSFDSPVDPQSSSSEAGAGEPQPDVSEEAAASNSMNDQVTSAPAQAPAPAVIAHHEDRLPPPASSTATQPNVNSWPTLTSIENEPPSQSSGPETSSPSDAPTSTPNNKSAAASAEAADIQKLVDDITARATATVTSADTPTSVSAPLISGPLPPSLPPKPLLSAQPHAYQPRGPNPTHNHNHPLGPYRHSLDSMEPPASVPGAAGAGYAASFSNHAWDTFVNDERTYTSEQNWDRFPEGARIFVGNLSSDRVSKKEVFAVFSKYGRLAQISMKSAYGFVQYHNVSEAQAALEACQDMELGGRRIHLEISRRQKKKGGDDRGHSPDRRGGPRGMANDRLDLNNQPRDPGWKRTNDHRRSASPRRDDPRGFYSRDRDNGPMSHDRRRSRSPRRSRFGSESYRRRSPSPHRRTPSDVDRLDIPRRYGNDVPDVQILLLQDLDRPFVDWVQNALHAHGLKTAVMHLNPRFPRNTIVQRQVLEGVHAIIDLDQKSRDSGLISLQLFIRNSGTGSNIRFESYNSLNPELAGGLVMREKTRVVHAPPPPPPPHVAAYPPTYQPPPVAAPTAPYQSPIVPPPATGYQSYPPASSIPQAAPAPPATPIDNDYLRSLLTGLQTQQQSQQQTTATRAPAPQIDINALLGSLQGGVPQQAPPQQYGVPQPPQYQGAAGYYGGGQNAVAPTPVALGNNAHIQNIMENLKRASGSK